MRKNYWNRPPLDHNHALITAGAIVCVYGTLFSGEYGLVMDTRSTYRPQQGRIAVFFEGKIFDENLRLILDSLHGWNQWKGSIPTPENYQNYPRVVCFNPRDLFVVPEVPLEALVRRAFSLSMLPNRVFEPTFPLVPNTHGCQFGDCISDLPATRKTLVNASGNGYVVYACEDCHAKNNGWCMNVFAYKNPMPGVPPRLPTPSDALESSYETA